jgi:hypothetical protein
MAGEDSSSLLPGRESREKARVVVKKGAVIYARRKQGTANVHANEIFNHEHQFSKHV